MQGTIAAVQNRVRPVSLLTAFYSAHGLLLSLSCQAAAVCVAIVNRDPSCLIYSSRLDIAVP
eukprot:scaffold51563_cov31-Tisochrysis_lutea.AAC.2